VDCVGRTPCIHPRQGARAAPRGPGTRRGRGAAGCPAHRLRAVDVPVG